MESQILAWNIRRHGIEMASLSNGSHIASVLSVADIIAVLYADFIKYNVDDLKDELRDRVILSKGHAGAAIYSALAECGFFSVEKLKTHYQNNSLLSGHVSHHVPGVELSTGSLGHGLSVGAGMALALKKRGNVKSKVYVILGDGECDEGSIWECALFSNHYSLDNLIAIIDYNKMQSLDYCKNTIDLIDLPNKWKSFGWNVIDVDGHSHKELFSAFKKISQNESKKPTIIIANTIKGKGVSFMENNILWHYRYPHRGGEYELAVNELHESMPQGAVDIYTEEKFKDDSKYKKQIDTNEYNLLSSWKPDYFNLNNKSEKER